MSPTATNLLTTEALRQRTAELYRARIRLDAEYRRLTAALEARSPRPRRRPVEHGTEPGYKAHLRVLRDEPCEPCREAHAAYQRERQANPIEHGTEPGYKAHTRRRTPPCGPCKAAHARYSAERRAERRTVPTQPGGPDEKRNARSS